MDTWPPPALVQPPRVPLSGIIRLKSVGSRHWTKTNLFRDKEGAGKWRDKRFEGEREREREAAGERKGQWIAKGGACLRNKVMLVGGG